MWRAYRGAIVTSAIASAPGKVVISGEYAVLEGSPAICMAIDRRARAEVSITTAGFQTVRTSGYVNGAWRFRVGGDGNVEWIGGEPPDGSLDLLLEIWASMGIKGSFDIRLDTAEFFDPLTGSKFGLGSSAALTVALFTAFSNVTKRAGSDEMNAAEVHRRLQHGRGSGVDIAASLAGGVIEYRMTDAAVCRQLAWPRELEYAILWSGQPASTSEKLQKFDQTRRSEGSLPSISGLCEAAESIAGCWSAGNTVDLLDSFHRYIEILMQFDVDHGLGIFDAGHKELAEAAANRKLVYKPCGAGGGDTGMVFATDSEAVAEFANFAGERGYRLLDVSLEASGVILES